jgi:hypothetical protein
MTCQLRPLTHHYMVSCMNCGGVWTLALLRNCVSYGPAMTSDGVCSVDRKAYVPGCGGQMAYQQIL